MTARVALRSASLILVVVALGESCFDPPVVRMSSRTEAEDGMETHICRLDGFYPREINASWRRDGEVWEEETFHGSVAPNADGTYHYWLSIRIDPKERGRYRCHVEHDGLQEPLDLALKVPGSNVGLIIGCLVVGLVLACVIAGTLIFFKMAAELDSGEGHRPVRESGDDCDDDPASDREIRPGPSGSYVLTPEPPESDSSEAEKQGEPVPSARVCRAARRQEQLRQKGRLGS